jgi:hypothetical protein
VAAFPRPAAGVVSGYYAYLSATMVTSLDRIEIICANDEEAKDRAKQLVDGHAVELWQEARKIATFKPKT